MEQTNESGRWEVKVDTIEGRRFTISDIFADTELEAEFEAVRLVHGDGFRPTFAYAIASE